MTALNTTEPREQTVATLAAETARSWLDRFVDAFNRRDRTEGSALFHENGWWRDLLTLDWDFHSFRGQQQIATVIDDAPSSMAFRSVRVATSTPARLVEIDDAPPYIEALFEFDTEVGTGRGVLRLTREHDTWRAWTLYTALQDLHGREQRRGSRRPRRVPADRSSMENWSEWRARTSEFADSEPRVLIIGAGHNGLMAAAHLGFWGVETLIIESNARVGDNWRKRYRSLVLHDAVWADHLPGLDFPDSWPVYMPKDKLGDWLELYASAMELNVWTGTRLLSAAYDDQAHSWTVSIQREDGSTRVLHPTDIVMATGIHGEPRLPYFPGMDRFAGKVVHSSAYVGDEARPGDKALVVGAGNSAHDAAENLALCGAEVTLVQRSSTYVCSQTAHYSETIGKLYHEDGMPLEDADLLSTSFPNHLALERATEQTRRMAELDKDMLEGLARAGYWYDMGIDGGGGLSKILNGPGGYYLDVGCAALIASGQIKLVHAEVVEFTETTVVFADGTELQADVVVLATGYSNMRETARRILGDDVADRCVPIWGMTEDGEMSGVWRRSGHAGLWFQGGPLYLARVYSRYLALQIHAIDAGLSPR